jgi:drug/metabolite transporter (DMT)-like permease
MALTTISAGKTAFICSLTVVVVPIASALIYHKPIKWTDMLAAFVALAGVGVLEGMVDVQALITNFNPVATTAVTSALVAKSSALAAAKAVSPTAASAASPLTAVAQALGVGKGDILALGQPLGFGYCFTRIEYYQKKFANVPNRVLTIAAAQCVMVGFLSFLWVLYDFHGTIPDFTYMVEPHRLVAIGWTGIVTTVIAIFLQGTALQTATATDAAIVFSSEPVWASLFGFLLLHEQLGINSYVGGVIILLACLIGAASDLTSVTSATSEEVLAVELPTRSADLL